MTFRRPRTAGALLLVLLPALLAAPLASAALFPGSGKLSLEHVDEGRITASARHEYDDWLRTFELSIHFSRIGVYDLARLEAEGVSGFLGSGEEYREATGTLRITLDDQGVESSLDCTLALNETKPSSASLLEYQATMVLNAGRGLLDDEAWDCQYGGNEVVHGGPEDVPLSSYAFAGVEGREAGTFPAELAVMLGYADDASDWSDEIEEVAHAESIVQGGYAEFEPTLGEQSQPYSRTYDVEDEGGLVELLACGSISVTETPATTYSCQIDGEATITVSSGSDASTSPPRSSSSPAGTPSSTGGTTGAGTDTGAAAGSEAEGGSDTPGVALWALVAAVGVAALALRRRG